jgi:hypothetical protein
MTYKIAITQKPTHTHFFVTGENSLENSLAYIQDIHKECVAHNYKTILIEERLEGRRLGTMDLYDIAIKASEAYMGFYKAIAYVNVMTEKKTFSFIENLCVNRSLPLRAFPTVEEAEKWLAEITKE